MIEKPNSILISGTGRNVGKTLFACRLIKQLSVNHEVIAIKMAPHFHPVNKELLIYQCENFEILKEKEITNKDSSRMLQAGAKDSYYIQCKPEYHLRAFTKVLEYTNDVQVLIIESGGLNEDLLPGLRFFIDGEQKEQKLFDSARELTSLNPKGAELFDVSKVIFSEGTINIKTYD